MGPSEYLNPMNLSDIVAGYKIPPGGESEETKEKGNRKDPRGQHSQQRARERAPAATTGAIALISIVIARWCPILPIPRQVGTPHCDYVGTCRRFVQYVKMCEQGAHISTNFAPFGPIS